MLIGINALACEPGSSTGDATYVRELVAHLSGCDPSVRYALFAAHWQAKLFRPAPNLRIVPCGVPRGSRVLRAIWEQVALPAQAARVGVDLFHAPVNVAPLGVRGPLVLTLLEAEPFLPGAQLPAWLTLYWRALRGASARRAQRVLAISDSAAREIITSMALPPECVTTIPLGVDLQRFQAHGLSREPGGYLLWIGQAYPRKNLELLIQAYALLRRAGDNPPPLHLLGPSAFRHARARALVSALGLGDWVRFEGWIPDANLAAWYRGAALLVLPSGHEAFGLPLLEALACGTAVLASDLPALREVGGDAAAFVRPVSAEALATVIQSLLDDPGRRGDLAAAGPLRAAAFSWEGTARGTLAAYRSVLGSPDRPML